jgi:hypothetical protein
MKLMGMGFKPTRTQVSRVPKVKNPISGGCLSEALQARSEFRPNPPADALLG